MFRGIFLKTSFVFRFLLVATSDDTVVDITNRVLPVDAATHRLWCSKLCRKRRKRTTQRVVDASFFCYFKSNLYATSIRCYTKSSRNNEIVLVIQLFQIVIAAYNLHFKRTNFGAMTHTAICRFALMKVLAMSAYYYGPQRVT